MQRQDRFFVFTIFLVVVLSIFHSGEALKCYNCNSLISATCEKESTSQEVIPCPDGVCLTFSMNTIGIKSFTRTCGFRDFCKHAEADPRVEILDCKECNTDLCNASATNAVSTIIMITSGLITLLWTIQ
ncbi:UPAR/Ly6 domain-containing protein CG9338-like [Temnothorax nylanderi]|uniref:UPAR/Ly6 domain-containing protein CG9338-like n=1 Tax=Temnothorax nylanderi TaxID=102681 RepID=UPI003A88764B